jgi:hypothetical protein
MWQASEQALGLKNKVSSGMAISDYAAETRWQRIDKQYDPCCSVSHNGRNAAVFELIWRCTNPELQEMTMNYFKSLQRITAIALCFSAAAVLAQTDTSAKDASDGTIQSNRAMAEELAWQDVQDFDFAQRGFIGKRDSTIIRDASGKVIRVPGT